MLSSECVRRVSRYQAAGANAWLKLLALLKSGCARS
jgi:hypothetical protein